MAKLGEIIIQIRGVSYSPQDLHDTLNENSVPLLRASNIQNGNIVLDDVVYVSKAKVSEKQYLRSGDILICTSSGSKELVGKAAFVKNDMPVTFGAFCKVIRPVREYQKYIGHFFQSPYYRRKISELSAGANINNIRNEHIENLEIPLPKIEEQRQIATVLDKVDDLIAKRRAQLDKLDLLVKSRFLEMFGDPVYNSKKWKTTPLNELCHGIGDGLHGTPSYDNNGKYVFINGNNLSGGKILITKATKHISEEEYKRLFIKISRNAILISINGTLGKLGFYNGEKVALGKSVCYCNLDDSIDKLFVYGIMNSDAFAEFMESSATKSTIKNVGLKAIREFRIILPPKELQNQFVSFVEQINESKLLIQQSLDKLETTKKALMQKYFV